MKILSRVSSSFLKLLCNSPDLFSGIAQMCQEIGIRLLLYYVNWSVRKGLPAEVGVWVEIENLRGKGREVKQVEPKFNLREFKSKRN